MSDMGPALIGGVVLVLAYIYSAARAVGDEPLTITIDNDCTTHGTCGETTRGIRNNNPGNIRAYQTWVGQVGVDSAGFLIFEDPVYGIRAMAKDLSTKAARGLNTVQSIISAWAPEHENPTNEYVRYVSSYLGVSPSTTLGTSDRRDLIVAIISFENGYNPYPDSLITRGIELANGTQ